MRTARSTLAITLLACTFGTATIAATEPELGSVHWGRDLDAALATSRTGGLPVLVLFDEVPGCATCRSFGQDVLSNLLLAEAIESEFVPVFVANNHPGRDAGTLARFGEPAWNNPVVRFLDARGRDLIARRDGLYGAHEISVRLAQALRAAHRPVPAYLALTLEETQQAHRQQATFGMSCFWEGEARLGGVPGVLDARAVHLASGEGVRVTYDASRLSRARLDSIAREQSCVLPPAEVGADRTAGGDDHLHALARSPLRVLPLTPMQAMRMNAALHAGSDPLTLLSPRQRAWARRVGVLAEFSPQRLARLHRPDDPAMLTAYARELRAALAE